LIRGLDLGRRVDAKAGAKREVIASSMKGFEIFGRTIDSNEEAIVLLE
jgi:hypothetical protein